MSGLARYRLQVNNNSFTIGIKKIVHALGLTTGFKIDFEYRLKPLKSDMDIITSKI